MDVDTAWRRKRPAEDEEYLESKRHLSEHFFKMKISQPQRRGFAGVHSSSQNFVALNVTANETLFDAEASMADDPLADVDDEPDDAPLTPSVASDDTDDLDDPPGLMLSRVEAKKEDLGAGDAVPTSIPFRQPAASTADERVDDWVRSSRQRMLADASVASAPDICRALILYKPLPLPGIEGDEAAGGGSGEGGGDPTPPPRSGGDDDKAAAPTAQTQPPVRNEQSAGSSTAEAACPTADGGAGTIERYDATDAIFGPSRGICTSPSGADEAGGTMSDRSLGETIDGDAMEVASTVDDDAGGGGTWTSQPSYQQVDLTRVGSSRGVPTPELTPEWVAQVRQQAQDPGERAGGPSLKQLPGKGWRQW